MSSALYSVWLQQCIGYNSHKIKEIISYFGTAAGVYNSTYAHRLSSGLFSPKQLKMLGEYPLSEASKILDDCAAHSYTVLTIEDKAYPRRLYEISNPPAVLYISGKMPDVDNTLTIGIVGTRTATSEGIRNSYTFGRDLSHCGAIVVSGGALGVDCASHRGVLQQDGITVCVLGCGINYNYLSVNAQMRRLITKKGAVISEYPPGTPAASYRFPERNRIISGLSNGVLVIEAGVKSGSLITARLALEQNRDVFSVPGSLINKRAQGSNALLKQGAITVTSYKDIIAEYADMYSLSIEYESAFAPDEEIKDIPVVGEKNVSQNKNFANYRNNTDKTVIDKYIDNSSAAENEKPSPLNEKKCPDGVSDDARLVYSQLTQAAKTVDEIAEQLGFSAQQVMSALTELEIFDAAENFSGGRYIRK